jgi:hypothetical protein
MTGAEELRAAMLQKFSLIACMIRDHRWTNSKYRPGQKTCKACYMRCNLR